MVKVAPDALIQSSITNTLVKGVADKGAITAGVAGSYVLSNVLIGVLCVAGAAGAVAGIVAAKKGSGSGPSIPAQ